MQYPSCCGCPIRIILHNQLITFNNITMNYDCEIIDVAMTTVKVIIIGAMIQNKLLFLYYIGNRSFYRSLITKYHNTSIIKSVICKETLKICAGKLFP